jgi:NifU-like protein
MDYLRLPVWERYGKKLRDRIERPRYIGTFTAEEAQERGMRLALGRIGSSHEAIQICLYWLVDESDGIIADAKFQALGPTGLIASCDAACEMALRKNYDQASRFSADLIERHLRENKDQSAIPEEWSTYLNRVIEAIDLAISQCSDIPFAAVYDATPIEEGFGEIPGGLPGWDEFPEEKKLVILDDVVDREIRPYVELDAGGVKVLGIRDNGEVRISYEGACTTCHSSTGSTLSAIQKILRARVHPSLTVIPEL